MRKGQKIRSDLSPNRENRRSVRQLAQRSAFGIYRPLSEESEEQVKVVLNSSHQDIIKACSSKDFPTPELIIPNKLGVTYLERGLVLRALRNGLVNYLELRRLQESIEVVRREQDDFVDVPLTSDNWFGGNRRKFGWYLLAQAAPELIHDTLAISDFAEKSPAGILTPSTPDHFTACKIRVPRSNYVAESQRQVVAHVVTANFADAGIESVRLAPLIAGASYERPMRMDLAA